MAMVLRLPSDGEFETITFATDQVERYIETNQVQAIDGSLITLDAESICIHGDGPNAVEVSLAINEAIKKMSCLPSAIID